MKFNLGLIEVKLKLIKVNTKISWIDWNEVEININWDWNWD